MSDRQGEQSSRLRRIWRWLTTPVRAGWRWLTAQKSLGHALVIVVAIGLLGAFVAWVAVSWILGQGLPWTTAPSGDRLELTKLALTVVGGAGAIVALTVAYRRQKDLEDGRFTERFGAAAAQLGADTPAERLAGVYAMAGVADRYPMFAQQCIDVLCGYLRLPFDPDPTRTHLTQVVTHETAEENKQAADHTYQLLPNDREVRDTVVRVIAAHVNADRETGWQKNNFDLTGATLTTAPFGGSHFLGTLDCARVTFTGSIIRFGGAIFSGDTLFDGATFSGDTHFYGAKFSAFASFDGATFTSIARFDGATFTSDASFDGATFSGFAGFSGATFSGNARFDGATFSGDAQFSGATFTRYANFIGATFSGDAVFKRATFHSYAQFGEGTFSGDAQFGEVTFTGGAQFDDATFHNAALFHEARFHSAAWFNGATFSGDTGFGGATFTGRLTRRDDTTAGGTDQPLGPALGFPDPDTDSKPDHDSG